MFISIFNICVKNIEPYNIPPFFRWFFRCFQGRWGKNLSNRTCTRRCIALKTSVTQRSSKVGDFSSSGFLRIFWGSLWGVLGDSLGSLWGFLGDLFVQKWGFFGVIPLDFVGDFVWLRGENKNHPMIFVHKKTWRSFFEAKHLDSLNIYIYISLNRRIKLMLWVFLFVKWVFPKIGVPQNGWFIMENPIKIDDLGVPLFLETPKCEIHPFQAQNPHWVDGMSMIINL